MNFLDLPPELWYLELAIVLLTLIATVWGCLLIRAARREFVMSRKPPVHMPSTPLTREARKRVRELTIV